MTHPSHPHGRDRTGEGRTNDDDELEPAAPEMGEVLPPADPTQVAADVRQGDFVRRCLALAAWVGQDGRRVTATGVLELADARAAFLELELGTTGAQPVVAAPDHQLSLLDLGQEAELAQQRPLAGLRSAADLPALHELWRACLDSGLVMVIGPRAYGADRAPDEDLDWCALGMDLAASRLVTQAEDRAPLYLFALWPQLDHEWTRALGAPARPDGTVSRRQLTKAWWRSPWNEQGRSAPGPAQARSDHDFRAALDLLCDLGVWSRDGDRLTGTAWGLEVASALEPSDLLPDPFAGGTVAVEIPVTEP